MLLVSRLTQDLSSSPECYYEFTNFVDGVNAAVRFVAFRVLSLLLTFDSHRRADSGDN